MRKSRQTTASVEGADTPNTVGLGLLPVPATEESRHVRHGERHLDVPGRMGQSSAVELGADGPEAADSHPLPVGYFVGAGPFVPVNGHGLPADRFLLGRPAPASREEAGAELLPPDLDGDLGIIFLRCIGPHAGPGSMHSGQVMPRSLAPSDVTDVTDFSWTTRRPA